MQALDSLKRVLVGIPLILFAGCEFLTDSSNDNASAGTEWEAGTNLTAEYGGYEFTPEQPAFGDPTFAKIDAEEQAVQVESMDLASLRDGIVLRIQWGQLRGNPELEQATDWSGRIAISAGGIAVLRTIAFEAPGDHLLPRESRQVLGFVSHTRPHFDGLLLAIHPGDAADVSFGMETGPFTRRWTLEELRGIQTVIPVDDLGNAVAIEAITFDPACPNGFVRGHWVQRDETRGVFRGLWATELGHSVGYIRGHFGMNEAGEHVWFGKIIGRDGKVLGLARGQWLPSDTAEVPGGTFAGHWVAENRELQGGVRGHYLPILSGERGTGGFFTAKWHTACGGVPDPALP